jgi:hypothetical protein
LRRCHPGVPGAVRSRAVLDFTGGVTRADADADGTGCSVTWQTATKSAALPRLSVTDGKLYTVVQEGLLNIFSLAAIDAGTGVVSDRTTLGIGLVDPLQTAGTVIDRTYLPGHGHRARPDRADQLSTGAAGSALPTTAVARRRGSHAAK